MLFREKLPVLQVHKQLLSMGVVDISYVMLTRYKNDTTGRTLPSVIIESSQEEAQRSWGVLGKIIQRGEAALEAGAIPRTQDVLAAIKQQNEMMVKLGIGVNVEVAERSKAMLQRLVTEIVLPRITDAERKDILEAIMADEELANWVIEAE